MVIVDFARPGGGRERIAAVGSCRLYGPIREALKAGRGKAVWHAHNSFTHSPAEAAQQIEFVRGRVDIPDSLASYVFNQEKTPILTGQPPRLLEDCSTIIVEISSLDNLTCHDHALNEIYFANNFIRGASMDVLNWYRGLSTEEPAAEVVQAASGALRKLGRNVNAAVRDILWATRRRRLTADGFAAEVGKIVFDKAKRWIFMPLFNVPDASAEQVATRTALRDLLAREARTWGGDLFDPTPVVARAGRRVALDGDGADMFHYAPDFVPIVGEALYEAVMTPARGIG